MNFPVLTVILMLVGPVASLTGADLQPLLDNSPFGRAPAPEPVVVTSNEALLEFRSLVVEGGQRYFSIFDPTAQRGYWVAEGEEAGGISVASYNEDDQQLEVQQGGRTLNLVIKTANIVAGAAPLPGAPGASAQTRTPQVRTTGAADPKRLEAVAAEVRRRRALRQAATNATTQ